MSKTQQEHPRMDFRDALLSLLPELMAANNAKADLLAEARTLIQDLAEEGEGYASYACSEFCVHSTDPPESCPLNDPLWEKADSFLANLDAALEEAEL